LRVRLGLETGEVKPGQTIEEMGAAAKPKEN
jgi:hypothetical protein